MTYTIRKEHKKTLQKNIVPFDFNAYSQLNKIRMRANGV